MLFSKKKSRKWEFEKLPVVDWKATNKCKYDMTTICKLILTQILKIENVSLLVVTDDKMVKRFDTSDIEMQAVLQGYPQLKKYILYLRKNMSEDLLTTICHEMVHLKQYYDGKLRLDGTTFYWNGEYYSKPIPYMDRPWEKEAFAKMYDIEKEVKKLYYE